MDDLVLQVSDAIALFNQTLDYAYPTIVVEGEVSGFKVSKDKFVFFDVKDESGSLGCFMMAFKLNLSLEDGMKVQVVAQPKITNWGKFSLTVRQIKPVGEGSLRRAYELLKAKLDKEGLFNPERKRALPVMPQRIGVISSAQAAGYADFIKILNNRWRGLDVIVANTTVQGESAPGQIIGALDYFNQLEQPLDAIVIVRGGGSLDDLMAFNDEALVRAISSSRTPVLTGIGHEVDTSLADLAADRRAATPSNAAELLVPDRAQLIINVDSANLRMINAMSRTVKTYRQQVNDGLANISTNLDDAFKDTQEKYRYLTTILNQLDPKLAFKRGYSLVRDSSGRVVKNAPKRGDKLTIETRQFIIKAGVDDVREK